MPAPRLAIDLSSGLIRVLEGAPGDRMRSGEAAAPVGALDAGRVVNPSQVGQAIRQLVARTEIRATRALIAVTDALASYRVLTFSSEATESDIDAEVLTRLNLGSERMAVRHVEIRSAHNEREYFAAAWDRGQVQAVAAAVRHAGLEPAVVDLKSLCVARALTIDSCVYLEVGDRSCEAVLIDARVPRIWHTFRADADGDLSAALANGLKPVLGLHLRGGGGGFGPESPIVIHSEHALPTFVPYRLADLTGRPVEDLPPPPRADPDVRYGPYLTCLGLVMRRDA
ncbi:MAG TPA: hypothetical protein VJQ08_05485 [Candidatus Dormibacteraeota bacterium]|nr:hypothetical protein [Candidatus Dormibacteraeota bacterium]